MNAAFIGIRTAHDIAVDVAATGNTIEHDLIKTLNGGFQVAFSDTVQLKRLAGGEFHGAVAVAVGKFVHAQPLCRCGHAAGYPYADHERVQGLQFLGFPFAIEVAVGLLVGTVEFNQLCIIGIQSPGDFVFNTLHQRAPEVIAVDFDMFDFRKFSHE